MIFLKKNGTGYALKVVSHGIFDGFFAFKFSPSAIRYQWQNARQLGERRHLAERAIVAVGSPKKAQQIASQVSNPEIRQFVLDVGKLGQIGFVRHKRLNALVRNVFMAELRGSPYAAQSYIRQARAFGILKK